MAKRTRSSIIKSLDRLWSIKVRQRDPFCCKCGKPTTEAHHIFGRRSYATRWDLSNSLGLCPYCHKFDKHGFEQDPYNEENMAIILKKIGKEGLERLNVAHFEIKKLTIQDLLILEELLKQ